MTDARFPRDDEAVLGPLLARLASAQPDLTYAVFADGQTWTYADTLRIARRAAAGLAALGVAAGDRVLCWLPNGPDIVRTWFGANLLGATYVPVNLALRGALLEHVIATSGARVLVAHTQLLQRLEGRDLGRVRSVIVVGGDPTELGVCQVHPAALLDADDEGLALPHVDATSTQSIIYTSGTTGPSKGVLSSYVHLWSSAHAAFGGRLDADDRYLVNLPLFHAGGTIGAYGMLARGGSIAVVDAFDTASFWDVVRATSTTSCTLLGAMASFLAAQPRREDDRDHCLRAVFMVPLAEDALTFADRFGVDVYTLFNMTEVSCPLVSTRNPTALGTCGRPRPGVDVRLVDDHDREVAVGDVGELLVRTDLPWAMNHGYDGRDDATAAAWRNGWFHTGDAFRRDADGNFFFVDRIKDAIRRRGENISSFEVEVEVCAHPAVLQAAAVPVPSEHGEDDVLVAVTEAPGHRVDPEALVRFCAERMAHFMVPRYVRVVDALPMTATNKVQKHLLRAEGVTADTFDREEAGIRITRERIGSNG